MVPGQESSHGSSGHPWPSDGQASLQWWLRFDKSGLRTARYLAGHRHPWNSSGKDQKWQPGLNYTFWVTGGQVHTSHHSSPILSAGSDPVHNFCTSGLPTCNGQPEPQQVEEAAGPLGCVQDPDTGAIRIVNWNTLWIGAAPNPSDWELVNVVWGHMHRVVHLVCFHTMKMVALFFEAMLIFFLKIKHA